MYDMKKALPIGVSDFGDMITGNGYYADKTLMIEDHKEVRDFVKEYFDHKEIEVIEAQNGYEGLAILDDTIDIILLDIMMPGIDGYEVCKQIRSQYNTLIVFISALSEDENQLKAYECGADDYITKPFKPSLLYAKCLALLKRNKKIVRKSDFGFR